MGFTRTKTLLAGLALAATAACGNAGSDDEGGADVKAKKDAASSFKDGTQMKTLADQGTINVGVKFDQPGLGFKGAADKVPSGFDVEMAKVLVAGLGIDPDSDKVKWIETVSDSREPFLQSNKVDLVLASYSITPERRQVVGQAGPYLTTGQQVLVKEDSDVKGVGRPEGQGGLLGHRLDLARERQGQGHEAGRLRHLLRVRGEGARRHGRGHVDRRHHPARVRRAERG